MYIIYSILLLNPKLSQRLTASSYENFSSKAIINLSFSVVKPDIHLNFISKLSFLSALLLKGKLRRTRSKDQFSLVEKIKKTTGSPKRTINRSNAQLHPFNLRYEIDPVTGGVKRSDSKIFDRWNWRFWKIPEISVKSARIAVMNKALKNYKRPNFLFSEKSFAIIFAFKLTKPFISIIQNYFCTIGEHPRIEILGIITDRMIIRFFSDWSIIIVQRESDR